MNTAATKQQKRLSEQLMEAQALLQEVPTTPLRDLAHKLRRTLELLADAQKLLRGEEPEPRLF